MPKKKFDDSKFDSVTPESAYWIGFLAADGCVSTCKGTHRVSLGLQLADEDHLGQFRQFLSSSNSIRLRPDINRCSISVASRHMAERLKAYGVCPRKSKSLKAHYSLVEDRDFWRGIVDGDGHLRVDKKNRIILDVCGAKQCMQQYLTFCKNVYPTNASVRKHCSIFKVTLCSNAAYAVIKRLYQDAITALARKRRIAEHIIANKETLCPGFRKLTSLQAQTIRKEWRPGLLKKMTAQYAVCSATIWNVVNYKTFKRV